MQWHEADEAHVGPQYDKLFRLIFDARFRGMLRFTRLLRQPRRLLFGVMPAPKAETGVRRL